MTAATDEKPCALYRYYDNRGRLLYVGISYHAIIRASQHKGAAWYRHYRSSTVEHFASRAEAAAAEIAAIQNERPLHNKAHNRVQNSTPRPRPRPTGHISGTPTTTPKGHPWGYYHAEKVYRLQRVAPEILEVIIEAAAAYRQHYLTNGGGTCAAGFWETHAPAGRTWKQEVDRLAGWGRPLELDEHRTEDDQRWLRGAAWVTVSRLVVESAPACTCERCKVAAREALRVKNLTFWGLCSGCEQRQRQCTCATA